MSEQAPNKAGNEGGSVTVGLPDWQPIETAPKDGKDILLFWKFAGVGLGRWEYDEQWQGRKWAHKAMKEGWRCEGDGCIPVNQADCTHWQPLPVPPLPALLVQAQ